MPLALAAMFPPAARLLPAGPAAPRRTGRLAPAVAALAAAALFWVLRERHLFWGDGVPLSINIPRGQSFHPDEPLAIFLHQSIYRLGGGAWSGATAVAIRSVIAGSAFTARTFQWLERRIPDPTVATLASLALVTQGFTEIFHGYVENYAYLAVALLYFCTWGVDFLEGRIGPFRPLAASLVACAFHLSGWITLCFGRLERPDSAARVLEFALSRLGNDSGMLQALSDDHERWIVNRALAGHWAAAEATFQRMEERFPADPRTARLRAGLASR